MRLAIQSPLVPQKSTFERPIRERDVLFHSRDYPYAVSWWQIQAVNATHSLNLSAGVWKPSVLRGLLFNCLAIELSFA